MIAAVLAVIRAGVSSRQSPARGGALALFLTYNLRRLDAKQIANKRLCQKNGRTRRACARATTNT
jgi:hypothetical protein